MKILLNGGPREIHHAKNIVELLAELGLPAPAMLVEHNGLALRRDEWSAHFLAEDDRVEIIRIVAGG